MRRSLTDIVGHEAAGSLAALSGYLDAESEQVATIGGLVAGVGLVNGGADEIALLNPFVLVQFQLRDEQGFPLELPVRPPPMLVHSAGGEDWSLDGSLPVVGVVRNGRAEAPSSIEGRVIRFAAGEERLVSFAIGRTLANVAAGGAASGQRRPAKVELPSGAYRVRCLATLIDAEQTDDSRIVESDEIAVRLAAPAR